MTRGPVKRLIKAVRNSFRNYRIISRDFGQCRSMYAELPVDRLGRPLPWYTYPAIEYLRQLDLSDRSVFEFGSGNSTMFWSEKARSVTSVEHDSSWYLQMKGRLPVNVTYLLRQQRDAYVSAIAESQSLFDVIVIDGIHRPECWPGAIEKLSDGGFIILDNADWHPGVAKALREHDLIEVDMAGFGPINGYTWTTSFFFSRNVKLKQAQADWPGIGPGGMAQSY